MRQSVFMDNEDTLHCPPHPHLIKLFPHPLEPGCHRAVLLIQRLLGTECVVGEGVSDRKTHKKAFQHKWRYPQRGTHTQKAVGDRMIKHTKNFLIYGYNKGFSQENNWFYLIIQGCSNLFIKQLKPRFYV